MKIKRLVIIGLIIVLALLYTFSFNMKPANIDSAELMPFSKDGFTDSETLTDTHKLVSTVGNYSLYIDETTSYFQVIDNVTGMIWESNPSISDPWETDPLKSITNSALDKQKSTLELSYFNPAGSLTSINNYKYSIYHPEDILHDEGMRTYQIKYTSTGFQVLYIIEDVEIDYLYFPKFLTPEVLESIPNRQVLETIAYTGYDEDLDIYEIVQYEDMSRLVKKRLYDAFYGEEGLGYTREQAIAENATYGYNEKFEKVRFEIGVDVTLLSTGIETTIINNSIVEPDNVKLGSISLYPLFGTAVSEIAGVPTEGYLVIPDGSGAIIEFNNGKSYQEPYIKRLYGEDLALLDYKKAEVQEKISIPLYGMVKENGAYAAIITKGDTMATIKADVSGRIDSYNKIFTSFNLRENESITIGTGYNQYGIDLWTKEKVQTDFTVSYTFLDETKADYVNIAKVYRDYLITNKGFTSIDNTSETILTAELIGAYDRRDFFLGVPYDTNESLTTFDEAQIIINELLELDITNMNVIYAGMVNGGLSTSLNDEFDIEKVLGGTRDYNDLVDFLTENNIELFPSVKLMTTSDYNKMFDRFRYTANRIDGSHSLMFNYHLPSKLPYSETNYISAPDDFVVNPLYLQEMTKDLTKDYDGDKIAFNLLGSVLGGNYNDDAPVYKQDALVIQESIMSSLEEKQIVSNPLGFAIPYSDFITNLPSETTLYAILDYQIPLVQLVLSGMVDYSTSSLNLSNVRTAQYNFLKIIETGSNIKYTLSYDDSKELRETVYNYYLSTQYNNWLDNIEESVKELDQIGIHEGVLVNHEQLQTNVYKVTYSHGLEIVINYNLSSVVIDGETINAMDYLVLEVD